MTTRETKISAGRCISIGALMLAAGSAAGYSAASLASGGAHGAMFATSAVAAILALVWLAMSGRFARGRRTGAAAQFAGTSVPTCAPVPARVPRPGDILIPIDAPVVDEATLEGLRNLGGDAFVNEVVAQFISEGRLSLRKIAQAIGAGEGAEYAAQAHALRSSAANVGARRLYKLCLEWRDLAPEELAVSGAARLALLQDEFTAVEQALSERKTRGEVTSAVKVG